MIKMIACDLDGTLLSRGHLIHDRTLQSIHELSNHGIQFVIATGRSYPNVSELIDQYHLNYDLILNTGHEMRLMDGTHRLYSMKEEFLRQVCEVLLEHNYHITLYSPDTKYTFDDLNHHFDKHLRMAAIKKGAPLSEEELANPYFQRESYLQGCAQVESVEELIKNNCQILKIDARSEFDDMPESVKRLSKIKNIDITSSFDAYIEIVEDHYNKGIALMELATLRGIKPEEIAIFGDSSNDMPMFTMFEHSFAPQNAKEEILSVAKYILPPCEEDAVYHGIQIILNKIN